MYICTVCSNVSIQIYGSVAKVGSVSQIHRDHKCAGIHFSGSLECMEIYCLCAVVVLKQDMAMAVQDLLYYVGKDKDFQNIEKRFLNTSKRWTS